MDSNSSSRMVTTPEVQLRQLPMKAMAKIISKIIKNSKTRKIQNNLQLATTMTTTKDHKYLTRRRRRRTKKKRAESRGFPMLPGQGLARLTII